MKKCLVCGDGYKERSDGEQMCSSCYDEMRNPDDNLDQEYTDGGFSIEGFSL